MKNGRFIFVLPSLDFLDDVAQLAIHQTRPRRSRKKKKGSFNDGAIDIFRGLFSLPVNKSSRK
jgi:hypothetical protein